MAERRDNNGEATDHSLLRRYRNGEQDAATELYLRYASRLFGLARKQSSASLASRVTPDDVVQSVFRTFFRRVIDDGYDVPPGDELWQLLLVLALNKIRSLATFHSAQKRSVESTRSLDIDGNGSNAKTNESSMRVLQMTIDDLLEDLQPSQQQMIRMRIEGHSVPEIAGATNRSQRSVERVMQRFRAVLSETIQDLPGSDKQ